MKIRRLSPDLISMIAAGEVVERPAAVVKELVENAIDAGARMIRLELEGNGIRRIRVIDDGEGMDREDALLAFERHATSKLNLAGEAAPDGIITVNTLGFRGEALPSIAAVARVRLLTRSWEEEAGTEIRAEGGKLSPPRDAGSPPGTTIDVEDLFFNTPARKKFLKSPATEMAQIVEVMGQAALAHPGIAFRLEHEGHLLADLPAARDEKERIAQWLPEVDLISVFEEDGAMGLRGFVSSPAEAPLSRRQQQIFVNKRPVKHPSLSRAVYDAYGTLLARGRHPIFFLYLSLPHRRVDINVHPAKREVRFRDNNEIFGFVRAAVGRSLGVQAGAPGITTGADFPTSSAVGRTPDLVDAAQPSESRSFEIGPALRLLGQVYRTFLVAEIEGELAMVDQHAAHERILYERFIDSLGAGRIAIQPLLFPFSLELEAKEALLLAEVLPDLKRIGFDIDRFGGKPGGGEVFLVREVPALLAGCDLKEALLELIRPQADEGRLDGEHLSRMAASMACHAAVRANEPLSESDGSALVRDLLSSRNNSACPHGRPTIRRIPRLELEKSFFRK